MQGPAFHDVVCGLIVRSRRVLLVHRNASRLWAPDRWDAPGGHIEPGERAEDALGREMSEELGIAVTDGDARLVGRLTGSDYDARVFRVEHWSGEPENRAPHEHDLIDWFSESQLAGIELADPALGAFLLAALQAVATHKAPRR